MTELALWRCRIGTFCHPRRAKNISSRATDFSLHLMPAIFVFASLLILSGDVELNPGPKSTGSRTKQTTLSANILDSPSSPLSNAAGSVSTPGIGDVLVAINSLTNRFDTFENRITNIETKLDDIKTQQDTTNKKLSDLTKENEQLKTENQDIRTKMASLETKLDNIEGQARRNNIIIHGLPQEPDETWDKCETMVKELIRNKLGVENVSFERVHRLNSTKQPRPMIAKFSDFKTKTSVLREKKKLSDTNIYITEDYTPRVRDLRQKLSLEINRLKAEGHNRVSLIFDHLIVDGIRFNWDPNAGCARPVQAVQRPFNRLFANAVGADSDTGTTGDS